MTTTTTATPSTAPPAAVLHLEDCDLDAELVRDRLDRSGLPLAVERVADRAGFAARLAARRYDLILSDYRVPGFDGLDALDLAHEYQPGVPFVFVSGTLGEEVAVETLHRGATDYVLKERLARLAPAVERALAEAGERAGRRRAEERYTLLVEAVTDYALFLLDPDGNVASWDTGAERVAGWAAGEVLGRPYGQFHPADERAAGGPGRELAEALAEGRFAGEGWRVRADGTRYWARATLTPARDDAGTLRGFSAVLQDVTAARRDDERLRLLCEAAATLLAADDPDGPTRGLLDRVARHLDADVYFHFLTEDGSGGDALRPAACGIPDGVAGTAGWPGCGEAVSGAVARSRRSAVRCSVQATADPSAAFLRALGVRAYACHPLVAGGRLVGTLAFGSRTKDRFDADELEFLETVSYYVAVAHERRRLVGRLRDADRRKDEFLATLAHELRNPLAPVRNALQVIRLSADRAARERARDLMERQVGQMVRLIDDLLDVSRITRGKLDLRKERVELAAVVGQAVEAARPLIAAGGHDLAVVLPPAPVYLLGDPVRLVQVFTNLLNNAAKYTDRGGRVRVAVERQGSDAVVVVADTGVGIPADKLAGVFEMFAQVDTSLEKAQGGLGIGLTLVRSLVEMHGGSVEARSAGVAGRGSEFTVRLPVLLAGAAADPAAGEGEREAAPRRSILVVDDNRDGAESLAEMLRLMGNEVRTAHDGVEGVRAAEAFRPDVVLMDVGMPKLNGRDAARRIRAAEWGKGMVIVACTGWGQDEDKRLSLAAGCDNHMVKPINPADLERVLAGLVPVPA